MKKIVLISLGVGVGEFSQFTKRLLNATVALYYIGKILEKSGFEVEIIDQPNKIISRSEIILRVKKINPDVILFSQFFNTREKVRELILDFKKEGIISRVGVGGHDATFHSISKPNEYKIFDIVFQGPVLGIITEYMKKIINTNPSGTVFVKTLGTTENPNLLPVLEHDNYFGTGFSVSSFGCNASCGFCTTPQFCQSGWKERNIKDVFQEICNLKEKGGKEYFFLTDDDSLVNLRRGHEIVMASQEVGLKIMLMTKPRNIVRAKKIGYLAQWKNVKRIFLGIENGSPKGLFELKKQMGRVEEYLQDCKEALKALKENGISPFTGHINFTGPRTSFSQLKESAKFIFELGESDWTALTQAWRPYPGTVRANEFLEDVWIEKGELLYHFNDSRVEKFHRFVFSLRKYTDSVDNIIYSATDEIYFQNLEISLWNKYWKTKKAWNDITYYFFTECLKKFENGEKGNADCFLRELREIKKEACDLLMLLS